MRIKSSTIAIFASLLFGILVYLFWTLVYPAHLNYQEQYQCFLYTASYFNETVSIPGGFILYVSRFLMQFFYYIPLGAFIYALLLVLMQRLVWRVFLNLRKTDEKPYYWYPLSFLPAIAYWVLTCDENYFLAGILNIELALLFFLGCNRIKNQKWREIMALLTIPFLFVLAGGGFWFSALLLFLAEWNKNKKRSLVFLFVSAIVSISTVLICYNLVQYPMWRLWTGMNHFRYLEGDSLVQFIGWGVMGASCLLFLFLPMVQKKSKQIRFLCINCVLVFGGGYYVLSGSYNMESEEYMAYDKCVRNQNWQQIIVMADHKMPQTPYTVAYLNLALGKTGQLGDRMFHYYQHRSEGLIRDFIKHPVGALVSSEIYYHLGFINIGQCHAFEAMESIPDQQKSVRILKRLVETNLLNYQYEVARKYAHMLQHTQFYKEWADEALACMDDSLRFNRHKDWVYFREVRNVENFQYSEREKDMMLGLLYTHNYKNKMAFEYLMAYCLLNKDLEHFVQYFSVGRHLNYREIPRHFQEGLAMYWTQRYPSLQGMPWPINPMVKKSITEYASIYVKSKGMAQNELRRKYKNTFWYYANYEK